MADPTPTATPAVPSYESGLWRAGQTASPVRMPAGFEIPPPSRTGDARRDQLQDAMNYRTALENFYNSGAVTDPGERSAITAELRAARDDESRLLKDQYAYNEEMRKLWEKADAANTPEAREKADADLKDAQARADLAAKQAANYETPDQASERRIREAIASRAPTQGRETVQEAIDKAKGVAEAQAEALIAQKQKLIELGIDMTRRDEALLKAQLDAIATKYHQDVAEYVAAKAAYDKEPYDKLTMLRGNQADARAAQAAKLQGAQVQAGQYGAQATQGHALLMGGVQAGVVPSAEAVQQMYFDPHKRALDVLAQAMAQPDFDANQRAIDLLSQEIMQRSTTRPVAPTAPDLSALFPPSARTAPVVTQ